MTFGGLPEDRLEGRDARRLGQMPVEPRCARLLEVARQRVATQGDEERVPERCTVAGADRTSHLVTVHPGEANVAEDDVRPLVPSVLEPFGPRVRHRYLVARQRERLTQAVRRVHVVLDDQDALDLWLGPGNARRFSGGGRGVVEKRQRDDELGALVFAITARGHGPAV